MKNENSDKKNSKILLLIYDYFPNPSANTLCIEEIIKKLRNYGKVSILCIKSSNSAIEEEINGLHIYRVHSFEDAIGRNIKRRRNVFFKFLDSFLGNLYLRFTLYGAYGYTRCFQKRRVVKKAEEIIKKEKIDTVLSISMPFCTNVLAYKLKLRFRDCIKWIIYEFDPFSNNFVLPHKQRVKRVELEKRIYDKADKIISTYGINKERLKENACNYKEKIVETFLPNCNIVGSTVPDNSRRQIVLFYAGSFYGNIRTPDPLLKLLETIDNSNIKLNIYGCDISRYLEKYDKQKINVCSYGRISKSECVDLLVKSSIAVNFGNNIPNQMPSKVLDYLSFGMPIVNFYHKNCTLELECLKDYPLVLNICIEEIDDYRKTAQIFEEFLQENCNRRLSKNDLIRCIGNMNGEVVIQKIIQEILDETNYEKVNI